MTAKWIALGLSLAIPVVAETVWLDTLDLSTLRQGWGRPQINRSIRERPLQIAGRTFERGVGTHAQSRFRLHLDGQVDRFRAWVGVDDHAQGPGSVEFQILGDDRWLFRSGVMRPGDAAREVNVDLRGVRVLLLRVTDGGDGISYDHANWAEARFEVRGSPPRPEPVPEEKPYLLTPPPGPAPRICGPTVYGARPARPFLYRIPVQGERPLHFRVYGLPRGLHVDPRTGIVSGTTPAGAGTYDLTFEVRNRHGVAWRSFRLILGDRLALTPPMGWNPWYAHYDRITDSIVREAAEILVRSGLADVGYQYVNLDDCWMNAEQHGDPLRVGPLRGPAGRILPNAHFPDMRALTDFIHARGLKAGIYASPGPRTCAGFAGSFGFEARDARQFAEWGFDFLKYDWCSYSEVARTNPGSELEKLQQPYRQMGRLLREQPRDIVFNLCQYGMGEVWKWGAEVGGHAWRTGGDLGFELDQLFEVALRNIALREHQRPGAWNDPDYIQIGWIGDARSAGPPRPCPLTPTEQYAFLSLWALMAAPLFYSGDLTRLDVFTLNVLANPEVIDINQDPLGLCARLVRQDEATFVLAKPLQNGDVAVGLCNAGECAATVAVQWTEIPELRLVQRPGAGEPGARQLVRLRTRAPVVRDVWRHQDLGRFPGGFSARVPRRGVMLLRVSPPG
ncbi:MAG: NPCBM/NEW2 domain-containing protein [Limisphaera sp.]